jgi:glycine cleavage system H protein
VLKFSKEHEWVRVDGEIGTVGITDYAQQQLGDVVFVEVPEVGRAVEKGGEIAVVESVKAASDIYAPVGGTVVEANGALADSPGDVNADPMGKAWFFKLKMSNKADLDELMDQAGYADYVKGLE